MSRSPPDRNPPAWAARTKADEAALAAGCYWDEDQADRVVNFIRKYISPKYVTGAMRLFEWQERWLRGLYGWRNPDGSRRFRRAILHIGKKNGKTLIVACVAAYELLAAGVDSPLVCSFSTTKKNAGQILKHLRAAVRKSKTLRKLCKVFVGQTSQRIVFDKRDGDYFAYSSDPGNAEGENMSCSIVDEAHAHRSSRLYDTIEYAMLARTDGLQILISTAGDDLAHWYYGKVVQARNILAGTDLTRDVYAFVYEANEATDDLACPATWKKANPSLDLYEPFGTEQFRSDYEAARKDPARWLVFKRYRLNIFCRPEDGVWIELDRWDQRRGCPSEAELLAGQLYVGLDGSATTDPFSLSAVWLLPDGRYYARSWAWVAEDGVRLRERSNLPRYQQYKEAGVMDITPGGMIDKARVRARLDDLHRVYKVRAVALDINGLHVFGNELEGAGYTVFRVPQNHRHFAEPIRELAGCVAGGRFEHDGGDWLRWCVNCVRLDVNSQGEAKVVKSKSADHVDGAVALLMAFRLAHQATAAPKPVESVYKRRGLLVM